LATVGMNAPSPQTTLRWGWRGELALVGAALRSIYPYALAILAVIAVTLAYQFGGDPRVQVGGGYDAPYVRAFQDREQSADGVIRWRYATDRSRVILPGAGARDSQLVLTAGPRPDGIAKPVQVVVNGIALGSFTPKPGLNDYRFPLSAAQYSFGDLTVDLISEPQGVQGKGGTPIPFGPQLAGVGVAGAGGFVKPPLAPLAAWFVIAPALYFLLRRLGLRASWAAGVALLGVVLGAVAVVGQRLDLALFAPRLAFLLIVAYVLLVLSDLLVPRLLARGGVAIAPGTWRPLQLIFFAALVLKLGGVFFPQLFVIDQPWHNQQFEKVLLGRFLEIYRPGPGGISELPGQWGIQAEIPYPPFLFVFALPFYLGPLGRDLSINFWSVIFDCSRPFLLFFLARRLGASPRAGLIAAFVLALTPSTFLLHSWGNYPTTASQFGAFLFLVLLVANFRRLRHPAVFIGLLGLLAATMLLYTVTAIFIGLLLVLLFAGIAWRGGTEERRQLPPLGGILVGAALIAFFGYYVQFVGPLLTQTLPAFTGGLSQGESLGIARDSFATYAGKYVGRLWYYGILISLLLTPLGAWRLLREEHDRIAGPLLASWFAILAIFFVAGSRIDMVDKELWFTLPLIAICAGVACDTILGWWRGHVAPRLAALWSPDSRLGRLGGKVGGALLVLYLTHLTWIALALWYFRIMVTRHQ